MRILQIIPSLAFSHGGPTFAVIELSCKLINKGEEVTIFTTDADIKGRLNVPLNTPINIDGIKVFYFPIQYLKYYRFSLPLVTALRKNIPFYDLIHIHSLFQFSTLAASYYCQKYHKPYIIRPLGQLEPYALKRHYLKKKLYLFFFEFKNLERATAVHFTTEEEKKNFLKLGIRANSFVLPLGIDLDKFKRLPEYGNFRERYPELKDKKLILFLSRINFKKGLDILVKAFAKLCRDRDDIHLVIAGPDSEGYGKRVKKWLKNEGLLNRTTFTGMLLGKEKLAAFRDSDIFVLPSYSENFGLAVVEAMACGLPVVISNKVGIHREIQENNAGIVVECNVESLYQGIKFVLDNKDYTRQLSMNGKRLVADYYDIDKVINKMLEIYREIVERRAYGTTEI
jgi:glycosyltransferase involved in cell wall biosynthesis